MNYKLLEMAQFLWSTIAVSEVTILCVYCRNN